MVQNKAGDVPQDYSIPQIPDVSIVIRVRNEEKTLPHTLKRVFNQRFDGTFEVVIVDNESSDRTLEIAQSFATRILHIARNEFTYARALNMGCQATRGRFIVSLSGDAVPIGRYWLQTLIDYCDQPGVAGVSGVENSAYYPVGDPPWTPLRAGRDELNVLMKTLGAHFDNVTSAFKRSVWEEHPFSETATYAGERVGMEDLEWAQRVAAAGLKVVIGVPASVYHNHQQRSFSRRLRRAAKARFLLVLMGHPPYRFREVVRDTSRAVWGPLRDYPKKVAKAFFLSVAKYRASQKALKELSMRDQQATRKNIETTAQQTGKRSAIVKNDGINWHGQAGQ